ncbi:MAG: transcription termination/antitermination protein NusA [Firmicutes bacterium]|nr:transcription termination/antitermination protein NusA [Bacillota bacterium]
MNQDFMLALEAIEKEKGIAKDTLFEAIEAALISAYKRNFSSAHNVKVDIDRDTGEMRLYSCLTVVEKVVNPQYEIHIDDARKKSPLYELGDVVESEVAPKNFGRIAAQTAKQVVIQRIREAERDLIYEEYVDREEDIVTGLIQRFEHRNTIINLGKTEAILTPQEQMPGENYKQGDRLKAYILEVKKTTKGPQILVSRTHPGLLKRLFELEVPEIYNGVVEIKAIAREPGNRSKVAVFSSDKNIDPVGACVGPKGSRVQSVVGELKGEKIDIVEWDEDPEIFVARALSPARVLKVEIIAENKSAMVVVPDYQLSLSIGKEGQNVRLAAKLSGWKIDILSESEYNEKIADERAEEEKEEEGVKSAAEIGKMGEDGEDEAEKIDDSAIEANESDDSAAEQTIIDESLDGEIIG